MTRIKYLILSLFCMMFMMQGCVHGTLDDCPPMVRYAVAFTYTNHTGKTDRFYDDVKKINLYVFDENGLIYTTTTKISPYETNFNIPLDIPMGKYHIVAWGNVLQNEDGSFKYLVSPDEFEVGVTSIDDARLALQRASENLSSEELDKLFFGEMDVDIPLYISRVDTVSLTNNTNHVRVVLHWDHSGVVRPTEQIINYDEVSVRLIGNNAVYSFDNQIATPNNSVVYAPYLTDTTGNILNTDVSNELKIYYYPDSLSETTHTTVYDFSILRMFIDKELKLTVSRRKNMSVPAENLFVSDLNSPDRTDTSIGVDIVGTTAGTEGFARLMVNSMNIPARMLQTTFDKYENYRIDVYFRFDELANTYFTGGIHVVDWSIVDQGGTPGFN